MPTVLSREIVVVAVASVTLVLVEGDKVGISHVLWYLAFPPAQAYDHMQLMEKGCLGAFDDLKRDAILSRCL